MNQLSLNYLSLLDTDPGQGAVALRELLALYCHPARLARPAPGRGRALGLVETDHAAHAVAGPDHLRARHRRSP
jgi:type VI protein secretion system component VasA